MLRKLAVTTFSIAMAAGLLVAAAPATNQPTAGATAATDAPTGGVPTVEDGSAVPLPSTVPTPVATAPPVAPPVVQVEPPFDPNEPNEGRANGAGDWMPNVDGDSTTEGQDLVVDDPAPMWEDDPRWDCRWDGNQECGVEIEGMWYVVTFEDGSPIAVHVRS